jgi:hypothetical protein
MALNLSGPISLAGSTAGESIAVELGLSASGTISLNQTDVRTLAGVPSGAIVMPTNFYGKSAASTPTVAMFFNGAGCNPVTTRINDSGTIIGSQVATTSSLTNATSSFTASGTSTNVAIYYGGNNNRCPNTLRFNKCGALIGSALSKGTTRNGHSGGRAGDNLLVWGGSQPCCCGSPIPCATVTRINGCGNLVGSETTNTNGNGFFNPSNFQGWSAAPVSSSTLVFLGQPCTNRCTRRMNACGTVIGSRNTVSVCRYWLAAAQIGADASRNGGNATFYGGANNCGTNLNSVVRVNTCGTQIGSTTNVGTARYAFGGATVGSVGIFYGGIASGSSTRLTTRINACGNLVGSETNVGATNTFNQSGSSFT